MSVTWPAGNQSDHSFNQWERHSRFHWLRNLESVQNQPHPCSWSCRWQWGYFQQIAARKFNIFVGFIVSGYDLKMTVIPSLSEFTLVCGITWKLNYWQLVSVNLSVTRNKYGGPKQTSYTQALILFVELGSAGCSWDIRRTYRMILPPSHEQYHT